MVRQQSFYIFAIAYMFFSTATAQMKFYPLPSFPVMKGDTKTPGESGIPSSWHSSFDTACGGQDRSIGSKESISRCWMFSDGVYAYTVSFNFRDRFTVSLPESVDNYLGEKFTGTKFETSNQVLKVQDVSVDLPVRSFHSSKFGEVKVLFIKLNKGGTATAYVIEAPNQAVLEKYYADLYKSVEEYARTGITGTK